MRSLTSPFRILPALSVLIAVLLVVSVASAQGAVAAPAPGLRVKSLATPSTFSTSDNALCTSSTLSNQFPNCDEYEVVATNVGQTETNGSEIKLSDTVPSGLAIQQFRFFWSGSHEELDFLCTPTGQQIHCSFSQALAPDATLKLLIFVTVEPGAEFPEPCPVGYPASTGCVANSAEVAGGGAPAAKTSAPSSAPNLVNGPPAEFGFSSFNFETDAVNGALDTQAGDHPYELTTTIGVNTKFRDGPSNSLESTNVQDTRDVVVNLPLGFVGSALAAPQCTFAELSSKVFEGVGGCPADTIVGHISATPLYGASVNGPIYNMKPERGFPAEFAYVDLLAAPHALYTRVMPSAEGYVLQTMATEIPQVRLHSVTVTFYGVPAQRDGTPNLAVPFFTNPTDCSGEEPTATAYMDSWQHPARFNADGTPVNLEESQWVKAESHSPAITGCNALQFPAEIEAQPTTHEADAPSGLNFELKVPQPEAVGALATPTLKKIVTRLPEGLTLDPSAGDGLQACSELQIGWLGGGPTNFDAAAPQCPQASKIGTLELESPLIEGKLEGEVFLAAQNANPFDTTLAAYVVVNDPTTGVLIKIAGKFIADPHTGQLTAEFDENPNFPFSDLKLHFFGGPRGDLATPESCGSFTTSTELFPWSYPGSGLSASPFSSFVIDEECPGGFSPSFTAGSLNPQAGAYTPLVASFQRSDKDQELAGLSVTLPPGALAKVAGVAECSDAQIHEAEAGTGGCPAASEVGTVQTGVGPGPTPLFVTGKAYLTGPYNGGAYGLVAVVPAIAGPYDFGTVVVRQSLRINPLTAQVTDVSDPLPKIIDGIPVRVRRVDLTTDRPEFTFNPTNCAKEEFTGTLFGSPLGAPTSLNGTLGTLGYATQPGASSPFSTPFEVTNCATLRFAPKITVSTAAQASKVNGAGLHFKISYPAGAMGTQAWFDETKLVFPKQLPARLETIQNSCEAAVFEASHAACPAPSVIGHVIVHSQVLPDPLKGPVYFVSYGNKKFPEAVMVLQGDNVTVELHGETFITKGKNAITSATFRNIPGVPFESIEVDIPTGHFSEFGANLPFKDNYNFCGQKLNMPTLLKAQNGLEIHQTTKIAIIGCKQHKKHKASKKAAKRHR